jgi:hypothetical protein
MFQDERINVHNETRSGRSAISSEGQVYRDNNPTSAPFYMVSMHLRLVPRSSYGPIHLSSSRDICAEPIPVIIHYTYIAAFPSVQYYQYFSATQAAEQNYHGQPHFCLNTAHDGFLHCSLIVQTTYTDRPSVITYCAFHQNNMFHQLVTIIRWLLL